MALLYTDGTFDGPSLGPEVGRDVGESDGARLGMRVGEVTQQLSAIHLDWEKEWRFSAPTACSTDLRSDLKWAETSANRTVRDSECGLVKTSREQTMQQLSHN